MGLWSRFWKTFDRGRHSAEIEEELQFHLEMDAAEGRGAREARLRLGNVKRIKEDTRAMGIIEWLESALQDARFGLRQLRRTPALTLAVVLSLAIGMGANTAIFSLVYAAILKPLPVGDPDSLRIVEWTNDGFPEAAGNINGDFGPISGGRVQGSSIPANLYRRLAREQTGFEALVGMADPNRAAIAIGSSPAEQVSLQYVSGNFFQGLGVSPAAGRTFRQDEDAPGQAPVVIVSHRYWTARLGGGAFDRTVRINNVPARIVGVAPPGFFGLRAGQWTDVYAPLSARVAFQPPADGVPRGEDDHDWWVRQIGRLKPEMPDTAARTQIAALFRRMAVPEGVVIDPKKVPELMTLPGRRGFNSLNQKDSAALWILMLLVGVLLLIVCANVANLLLSRSVGRDRESAVRLALGATRSRLFRQHLIESGVFAFLGGAAGLALGYVLAQAIHRMFESGRNVGSAFDIHPDLRVLGYSAATTIFTALLFGLAPAVRAARSAVNGALKAHGRSIMAGRLRLPRFLVSIQIALCLTMLITAGLLGRSLRNLKLVDIGFDRENLAYATVNPSQAGYQADRVGPYVNRVRRKLTGLPGVISVSPVEVRLLSGNGNAARVIVPGRTYRISKGLVSATDAATLNRVGEGFFETLRIPLVAGRTFDRGDMHLKADSVVIDERFARQYFPGQNPVGRRFGFDIREPSHFQIVGVVAQGGGLGAMKGEIHFAIRSAIDSGQMAEAVRRAVASIDPSVPLTEYHTQTGLIDRLLRTERLLGFLSGAFSAVALTLAAIGLAGLLVYMVARRTNEIGIRMALGAAAGDVVRMVLRDSLWMVGAGIVMGLPCAWAAARTLGTTLFGIEPLDPRTAAYSLVALFAVALLAAWIPARRAARIDPMLALREE